LNTIDLGTIVKGQAPCDSLNRLTRKTMIAEMGAALGAVRNSLDLLRTLNKVSTDEKVRSAVFDLQDQLLSLQGKMFDANARYEEQAERVKALQKELDGRNKWDEESAKYQLHHPIDGMTVYKLKAEHNSSDAEIWACPTCFGNQKISFLNRPKKGYLNFKCHACGFEIQPERAEISAQTPAPAWKNNLRR
jgi:predicted RNA-binding Zn-ribbon protein involved in translation (DUF1610 family)